MQWQPILPPFLYLLSLRLNEHEDTTPFLMSFFHDSFKLLMSIVNNINIKLLAMKENIG